MEIHILGAFWQSVALKSTLFTDFALISDSDLQGKILQIAFFQKALDKIFLNSGFELSS